MMEYKGYVGVPRVDSEAGVIRGRVINTRDTITFQGASVAEATAAFRDSVEDYLEFCASRGESPDRPFSGKFILRLSPTLHRELALEAQRRGMSLNKMAGLALMRLARKSARKAPSLSSREVAAGAIHPQIAPPQASATVARRTGSGTFKRSGSRKAPGVAKAGPAEGPAREESRAKEGV